MPANLIDNAISTGFRIGMHQHSEEIKPFCNWLKDKLGDIRNVLEIGTLHGGTAAMWHELSEGIVITVDLPEGNWGGAAHNYQDRYQVRNSDLRRKFSRIIPLTGDSHSYTMAHAVRHILGGEKVDLLFIDGDHSFRGVELDYWMYTQFVKTGGVIAFHDIADTEIHTRDGVEVHRFFEKELVREEKYRWNCNGPWGGIGAIIR